MASAGWGNTEARPNTGTTRVPIAVRLRPLWIAVCLGLLMGVLPVVGTLEAGAATTPTQLVFGPQPGDGDPGTVLATQPTVTIEDASNAVVSTSSTVTLTLTGSGGAAVTGGPATLTCDQTSGGVTSMAASSGVAAFTGCKVSRGGVFSLTATDTADTLTQVSSDFFVTGPAQLAWTGEPNGGAATNAWTSQPQISVEDGHGTVIGTSTSGIHLAIKSGTGTSSAALTCTANPMAASSGVAQFGGCAIDKVGSGYELVATDGTDGLISPVSSAFSITPGAASSLAFSAQPPGGSGGAAFGTQPQVSVKDAGGNVIAGNTDAITLSIKSGTGTSGAKLSCTTNPVSAVNGVASFSGCSIDDAGSGYQLTATDSTQSLSTDSTAFTVGAGAATNIAFSPDPGGGAGGSAFGTQPVVTLTDAGGNPVAGSVTLSIKSGTGTPGATLSCATNPLAVNTSGDADFSGCSINDLGTGYVLTATSGSLSVDSQPFDISTGGPAKATFTTDPGDGLGGSALSTQPSVSLTDAGNNQAAGAVTLSITPGTGTPGATLTCATNPVSTSGGTATFSGCSVDKAGTGYTLTATSGSATTTSKAFSVNLGSPARLGFSAQPGGGTGGTPWTAQPVVAVEDAGGNQLPTSTASVALSVTPLTGAGTLHCYANALPAVRGAAQFTGCSIDKTASAYTLTATDAADGLTQTSLPFAVTPGPSAKLVFSAQPSGGTAGSVWATEPVVTIADAGGNVVTTSGAAVALSITPGTGTAGAALACASNAVGASAGTATFAGCSINSAGGGYTLTATDAADGLHAESLPFAVATPPPGPLGVAPTGVPLAQTFGNSQYGANPTDTADDVNTATGALTFETTDLNVAGVGEPLSLVRTYNSADTTGGSFGPGWTSILDASVSFFQHQTLTVRGEDGQQIVFTYNPATRLWVAPPGAKETVFCTPVRCTVVRFDGVTLTFNVASSGPWRLASYVAPDGQGLSFKWTSSSVTITVDRGNNPAVPYNVIATLDGSGHVTGVTTPAGRSVSFGYSGGHLSTVTDLRGHVWTYAYNGAGRLTTETDPNSHVRLAATYSNGRVATVSSEGSPKHTNDTFSYNGGMTTRGALISANGSLARAQYVDQYINNVLVAQTSPAGGISRYSYDAQINLIDAQNPLGWVQQLSYDANNNLVSQTVPYSSTASSVVKMAYDNQHRLVSQTDADGNTTTYQYAGAHLNMIYAPGAGVSGRTQFFYNNLGELVKTVGPTGQRLYTYDQAGNQTGVVLQSLSGVPLNGPGTLASYDEAGRVISRTDANGNMTTYTYDNAGDLLSTVAPGPQTTSSTYTEDGDVASTTDAKGNTTTYSWDEATLTRTSVTNGGSPSTNVFDPSGDLLTETNGANRSTTHVFDATGREVSTTDPSNLTTQYTYALDGNIVSESDNAGDLITTQFNAVGRPIRQNDNGAVTLTSYDAAGNIISTTDPAGAVTSTTYTALNKPASVTNSAGTTRYAYDGAGDVVATTNPDGHVTTYTYSGAGQQTSATTNGNTTSYTYDNNGNVKTTTDPDGRTTTATYNPLNLPISTAYTWSGHPSLTVTESYDALGRRTGMTDADGTQHTYTYDAAGDLTKATSGSDTFTYDYSHPGKVVETYPDGTIVTYNVDDAGNLMSVQSGTQGTPGYVDASYIRNQLRETTGISFSNGVFETQSLNQAGQVLDQSLQVGGTVVADDSFTYDANNNPLSQVDSAMGIATTNQYSYDGSERLTGFSTSAAPSSIGAATTNTATTNTATTNTATTNTATTNTATTNTPTTNTPTSSNTAGNSVPTSLGARNTQAATGTLAPAGAPQATTTNASASTLTAAPNQYYSYDAAGNIVGAGLTSSTYNADNELTSKSGPGGTTTYTYDKNGDLATASGPNGKTTYQYNAADELASVVTPTSTITYTYDGDGNRTSETNGSTVTQFVWDVQGSYPRLAIERNGNGSLIRRYIYGDGPVAMQTPTATYFYHLDPQGSVSELSDANGNIVAAYTYDAYGNVSTTGSSAPANPLLYKGQYLDSATGLYNMRARNYDPTTGRFTSQDTVAMAVGAPDISPYAFVDDRPTTFTDPTGTTPTTPSNTTYSSSVGGGVENLGKSINNTATQTVPGTDTVSNAKIIQVAIKPVTYALSEGVKYLVAKVSGPAKSVATALSDSTGEIAQVSEAVSEVGADTGAGLTADAAEAEANAASKTGTSLADFLGPALIVVGAAVGIYLTVEACETGPISTCVGDAVGTAVGTGLAVACLVATEGFGSVLCGMAAGIVSAALTEVIAQYGPQIAAPFISLYNEAAAGIESAVPVVTAAFETAANTLASVATSVGGAIATGFNEFTTAISSGFQTAMTTLVNAGYSAAQLAKTLANDFNEGVNEAVGTLVNLGYSIQNVANAAISVFTTSAVQFAQIMKDGFNYTVQQVAGVLKDVYNLGDQVAAQILKGVNFAVDQVASALQSVYNDAASAVATALQAVGYAVAQIGSALQQVFAETDQAVATALKALGYAADQVAGALVSLYNDIDSAVATALDDAKYTFNQIAGALDVVFNDVGQVAAGILKTLNTCVSDGPQACVLAIAGALQTVYSFIDVAAAQVLENIGFVVNDVASALKGVYDDIDTGVASALRAIGNTVTQIGTALNTVFSDADSAVATALRFVGYGVDDVATALHTVFLEADSAVAGVLQSIGYAVTDVATALENVFVEGAEQAATVLSGIFNIDDVSTALSLVYGEAAQGAAQILKDIGYSTAAIAGVLQSIFGEAAAAAAQILKNIGEAISDIASALESVFGEAVNDIGNILSDIGFSSSDIQSVASALGSAWSSLSSFGQSVGNCITSGFTDC